MDTARIALVLLLLLGGCSAVSLAERTPPGPHASDRGTDVQTGGGGGGSGM